MKSRNTDNEFAEQEERARQLLAPLQKLSPPSELCGRLRRTTMASVQQEGSDPERHSIPRLHSAWTRKIAVPLPLAALFILAFVSLIGHSVVRNISKTNHEITMPPVQELAATPAHPMPLTRQQTSNQSDQANDCVPQTWHEETVIAGLGRIATRTYISCEREEP